MEPRWSLKLVTAPTSEPLTLDEVKAALRLDGDDEDAWASLYAKAARERVERFVGRAILTQTWRLKLDRFPACGDSGAVSDGVAVLLPMAAPLSSLTSITYVDAGGTTTTWSSANYTTYADEEPARVRPAYTQVYPVTRAVASAVTVTYAAGYADAGAVPAGLKAAIAFGASWLYRHRGDEPDDMPEAFYDLLTPYRVGSYF